MILRTKRWISIGTIILYLSLPACSKEEKVVVEKVPQAQEGEVIVPDVEKRDKGSLDKMVIKIVPALPTVRQDLQVTLNYTGHVTYHWERNGIVIEDENTQRLPKERFKKGDKISVIVNVDGKEVSASAQTQNSFPEVVSLPFSPQYIYRGVDITVTPKGFDPDGDEVSFRYEWAINGEELSMEDGPVLKGDRFEQGDRVTITVTPFDEEGAGKVYNTIPLLIPNAPPIFISNPPLEFKDNFYTYHAKAEDADGGLVAYSLSEAPDGMVIDAETGEIKWDITQNAEGEHTVEIIAEDDFGGEGFQKYALTITIQGD